MAAPQSCSEEEIRHVVIDFYARARADPMLGPVLEANIQDWSRHLAKMVDFWSSALLGTARYTGVPMLLDTPLPGLTVQLFTRWLDLFHRSAEAFASAECRERVNSLAHQIAQTLLWGYQQRCDCGELSARTTSLGL